ncbi:Cytoplasmic GTPase/eEF2-like protein (ribosomal biogenesis) [Rhizophlyctis rosea]|uniref:Elongation factor-like 1 n=1 Tax=Rhizophlyctis rosea TaxID=64517 RepID=A0AAD5SCQ7_9FUNG|nr:Cytoplasmic GTPase/eEF2-like protein (ribosomal biogenesis) [Rhizophlyctis rosea]
MAALAEGLRLLNQADPCVEIMMQETGEQVILCAGELHLERCLKDLRESFAKIDIQVSPPIVPFRETISDAPSIVPAQQAQQFGAPKADTDEPTTKEHLPLGTIILHTPNKLATVRVRALPVPTRITDFLNKESQTVRAAVDERDRSGGEGAGGESGTVGDAFIERLDAVVKEAVAEGEVQDREFWGGAVERIWAFGPKRVGPNLLVNGMKDYSRPLWSKASASRPSRQRTHSTQPGDAEEVDDVDVISEVEQAIADVSIGDVDVGNARRGTTVKEYDGNINTGFQLSTFVGPLCGEPVVGVCYVVEDVSLDIGEDVDSTKLGLLSGQIISTVKEACRQAFLAYSPRLMLAMYSCDLQAPAEVLGKVYAVLARRRGRILSEEMKEGTPFFNIRSMLPVVESFGFSDDIRKRTSGAASPQLIFSGFEILDQDPFWVPTTEEELEDLGEKADRENLAKKYMESVRKRKGMAVEKKIVEHAEKQKTLKNK